MKCPRCGNPNTYCTHSSRTGKRGEYVSYYHCGCCGNEFNDEMSDEEYARFKDRCEEEEMARARERREDRQWERDYEHTRDHW